MEDKGIVIGPELKAKYLSLAEANLVAFENQISTYNWEIVIEEDGHCIKSFTRPDGLTYYYMEGICEAPLDVLEEMTLKPENRLRWDASGMENYRLAVVHENPFVDIVYYATQPLGGGLVSSRDFVDIRIEKREADKIWQAGSAVDFPGCPDKEGLVRAANNPCGFLLQKIDDKRSKVISTTCPDLKGWLPFNLVAAGTPAHLLQLIKDFKSLSEKLASERTPL